MINSDCVRILTRLSVRFRVDTTSSAAFLLRDAKSLPGFQPSYLKCDFPGFQSLLSQVQLVPRYSEGMEKPEFGDLDEEVGALLGKGGDEGTGNAAEDSKGFEKLRAALGATASVGLARPTLFCRQNTS
jgi:hypothetical protein